MVKAIIFDCFGVLTGDNWREFTASLPSQQRTPASELNRAYGAGYITVDEFLQQAHDLTGYDKQKIAALLDSETGKNVVLLDYIASSLKPRYKIGLLSNVGTNWIRDYLLTPKEQALFDDMIMSFEVGMAKPDPRIFELAAERLAVDPSECVLIDDIDRYCTTAQSLGMQAIVYDNFPQMQAELGSILTKYV